MAVQGTTTLSTSYAGGELEEIMISIEGSSWLVELQLVIILSDILTDVLTGEHVKIGHNVYRTSLNYLSRTWQTI